MINFVIQNPYGNILAMDTDQYNFFKEFILY